MNFSDLNKVSVFSLFALIVFSFYFYLVGYKEEIPLYMELMRVIFTAHYMGLLYLVLKTNLSKELLYTWLFLSFVLISFGLQYWRLNETGELFGASRDPYTYMTYATKYNSLSLPEYWKTMLNVNSCNVDDLGFFTIMYFISKLFGKDYLTIAQVLILCNGIIYLIGIRCFHKLCDMLLCDTKRAVIATVLWAGFTRLFTTSAGGAKEVFFTAFIIIAMYSIYQYKEHPTFLRLVGTLLLISINIFFRFAICYALLLSLLCIILSNEENKRIIIKSAFIVILFTVPILTVALPLLTGLSLEHILWVTGNRMDRVQGSFLTKLLFPPLSLLFGPFPNVDRLNSSGFSYAYSLFLKDFLSIYFLSAFVDIIKEYKYKYYPLLVFVFCNMLMCIVAGVTLDIRYHLTYIPFFFLLCMSPHEYNLQAYKRYALYIGICLVIFVYSNRALVKDSYRISSDFMYY